jgi:hypothetical protein
MSGKKFDELVVEAFCRAYSAGHVLLPHKHVEDPEPNPPLAPESSRIPAQVFSDETLQSPSLVTAGGVDTLKV